MSLAEYVIAKDKNCCDQHRDCKIDCKEMVSAAKIVLCKGYAPLPALWREIFPNRIYDCEKAHRRFLQMPVTSLTLRSGCVIVEKIVNCDYDELKNNLGLRLKCSADKTGVVAGETDNNIKMSRDEFTSLLAAMPNNGERERVKHVMASSHNMSARQGMSFGMSNLRKRAEKVITATERISRIKSKHEYFCRTEQKVYLQSLGRDMPLMDEHFSDSENEEQQEEEINEDVSSDFADADDQQHPKIYPIQLDLTGQLYNEQENTETPDSTDTGASSTKTVPLIDVNSVVVLDILRSVELNWFAFVMLMQAKFDRHGYTEEILDQFLIDFASHLCNLGLSNAELILVEQSRTAYLSDIAQKSERMDEVVSDENSSDSDDNDDVLTEETVDEKVVMKNLKLIRDKYKYRAKIEIAAEGLWGERKKTTRLNSVLARHPEIGEVMENMVKEADVGADKWRRTGVYTFSGDPKKEKKITYKKLQEKVNNYYGEKLSYGTIVQLCVAKNKRRISSKRYKGAANIKYQRARKGFNLKYNPDTKWSRSLYKCLDQLQKDGSHILLLNRDDQAGFRLDTTFTHKSTPSFNVGTPTLTTHTDFLNKHQTQLQTTCYNFTKTANTSEVCGGVVKSSVTHQKSPSQHSSDMQMLQSIEHFKPLFQKETGDVKDIECIRVDGASDEGPSHLEVQFLWTERHFQRPTKVTLVTSRCSGDSFLNRVELQNGCLSRGHSNLFIPSTLCGEPYDDEGQFNNEKHKDNMETAIQQYISRVDETPCMGTTIRLFRGMSEHGFVERRSRLLVFLKGNAKEKAQLKQNHPEEYKYFEKIWKIRHNHMNKTLPAKYIFLLKCCVEKSCPHPLCGETGNENISINKDVFCVCRQPEGKDLMICCDQCGDWFHVKCIGMSEEEGKKMGSEDISYVCQNCKNPEDSENEEEPKWYPDGPSFNFLPHPVIDTSRSWGSRCDSCGEHCNGHYVTNVDKLVELYKHGKAIRARPPSVTVKEAFEAGVVDVDAISKKCCLSTDEVNIWIGHLAKKKETKKKATLKAQETRRKNKEQRAR